jgi:small subunit ribosomal protein S11
MGKKKIAETNTEEKAEGAVKAEATVASKKRMESGTLHVQSTYNNTKVVLSDKKGNVVAFSSSGAIGFKGAKKGTPFAAAKVGEILAAKAHTLGVKEVDVVINGVGSGRESAVRGFISKGINLSSIKDVTPVPFNGTKPKKPRRV